MDKLVTSLGSYFKYWAQVDKYSELPSVLNKILDCEQSLFKLRRTEESKRAEKETGERQEALSLHPSFLTDEDTK